MGTGACAIHGGRFVLPGGAVEGGYLPVENGVFGLWQAERPAGEILDYPDAWIAPGLVDTHIHGFHNHATTDVDPAGIDDASIALAQHGTTSWLPTTFTQGVEHLGACCAAIAAADEGRGPAFAGARIQGIYLEGPFFTMKHVGAQNPEFLIDPSYDDFVLWQRRAGGRIVKSALAPERAGALGYIARLDAEGVATCIGHSDATFDQALAAVNAGASVFVHTYNGQRGLHHREPGVVGCAMATPNTYAEIICDGKHVKPAAIRALVATKGWQHVVPITDCLACGGMPDGTYMSGGLPVVLADGLARLLNADGTTGNIAGSVLTLAQGVKNLVDWGIVTAEQALRMGSEVAAVSACVDRSCGFIKPGRAADFNVYRPDLTLEATYVGGVRVAR